MQNYMTRRHPVARPGLIVGQNPSTVLTGVSAADIPFGMFVTGYEIYALPAAATAKITGVATSYEDQASNPKKLFNTLDLPYNKAGQTLSVLTSGTIWVPVTEDVEPGDEVLVRYVAEDNIPLGIAAKTAVTDKTLAVSGALFVSSSFNYVLSASALTFSGLTPSQTMITIKIARVRL